MPSGWAAGVPVHGRAHPGMIHYFYCMPRMIPYAAEAMRIIGAEIRYAVKLPATAGAAGSEAHQARTDPRIKRPHPAAR